MKTLLTQVAFVVGGQPYDWADVALAARRWGDWAILEEELRQGLACVKRLADADEEPDPDQVSAAAAEFRYKRNLLTADEAEAWLARWDLTTDSWMDYIERSVLRTEWVSELAEIVAGYPVAPDELADAIGAEGVCSGRFAQFARKLAGRASAYHRVQEEGGSESVSDRSDESMTETEEQMLPGMDRRLCREKMLILARLEHAFGRFCGRVLTPKAIREAVNAHHLDWIRLHCGALSFPDAQMAREALCCIREDGAQLAEVGREAKSAVHETRFFLEEADAASRWALLSAANGDLLGPLPVNGGFSLIRVHEKVLPSMEDPAVRQRAEQDVLKRAVDQEINSRVQWQLAV